MTVNKKLVDTQDSGGWNRDEVEVLFRALSLPFVLAHKQNLQSRRLT